MLVKKTIIVKGANSNKKNGIVKITSLNGVTQLTPIANGTSCKDYIMGLAVNSDFHVLPVKCGTVCSFACEIEPTATLLCVLLDQQTQDTLMEGGSGINNKDYNNLAYVLKTAVRSQISSGATLSEENKTTVTEIKNETTDKRLKKEIEAHNSLSENVVSDTIPTVTEDETAASDASAEDLSAETNALPEGIEVTGFMEEAETETKNIFYESVREQVERLFAENPRCEELNGAIAESQWVTVRTENSHYVVGILNNGGEVTHICYGVPGYYDSKPESEASMEWLPIDNETPEGEGYWVIYQDAVNGNTVSPC